MTFVLVKGTTTQTAFFLCALIRLSPLFIWADTLTVPFHISFCWFSLCLCMCTKLWLTRSAHWPRLQSDASSTELIGCHLYLWETLRSGETKRNSWLGVFQILGREAERWGTWGLFRILGLAETSLDFQGQVFERATLLAQEKRRAWEMPADVL